MMKSYAHPAFSGASSSHGFPEIDKLQTAVMSNNYAHYQENIRP